MASTFTTSRFDLFSELFDSLTRGEKISLLNDYLSENDPDNYLHSFDEDFFETFFSNKMDAVRATFFGNIQNWCDPYIKFNGYGNLESLNEFQAESMAEDYKTEIYNFNNFDYYIDLSEYDDQEE